jgi:hypothetical protein
MMDSIEHHLLRAVANPDQSEFEAMFRAADKATFEAFARLQSEGLIEANADSSTELGRRLRLSSGSKSGWKVTTKGMDTLRYSCP